MTLKVGDKVKILSCNGNASECPYNVGDILPVACVSYNGKVWLDGVNPNERGSTCDCGKHQWVFEESCLELIKKVHTLSKSEPYKFKTINQDGD